MTLTAYKNIDKTSRARTLILITIGHSLQQKTIVSPKTNLSGLLRSPEEAQSNENATKLVV